RSRTIGTYVEPLTPTSGLLGNLVPFEATAIAVTSVERLFISRHDDFDQSCIAKISDTYCGAGREQGRVEPLFPDLVHFWFHIEVGNENRCRQKLGFI